jgi:hypothetical protein
MTASREDSNSRARSQRVTDKAKLAAKSTLSAGKKKSGINIFLDHSSLRVRPEVVTAKVQSRAEMAVTSKLT